MSRWAVILAGGSGTRFWPLSNRSTPKQFLPLTGDTPLLRQALDRLDGLIPIESTLVITGERYSDRTKRALPELPADNVLAEPLAASTGPALTWATHEVHRRDPDAAILSLHADWNVPDAARFRASAETALAAAQRHDRLVTVGIVPTRAEEAYGYIVPGDALDDDAIAVRTFVEKPDAPTVKALIGDGALWNSGLFAWTASRFLAETRELAPEIAPSLPLLDRDDVRGFFDAVTPIAVDHSHFERSARVAVVRGAFPWDDVGTWTALARVRAPDEQSNVLIGPIHTLESHSCVAWAQDHTVVLDGVDDLVVVVANGVTLVTTRERASNLKDLLATLPADLQNLD